VKWSTPAKFLILAGVSFTHPADGVLVNATVFIRSDFLPAGPSCRRYHRPNPRPAIDPHTAGPYTAPSSERVAQMVEHVTFNHGVLGSIPSALTKQNQKLN
jgi:hypothetical protein